MSLKILEQKEMERLGMGALLGVAKGSHEPPKFIILQYQGAKKKGDPPVVLVGKTITFDTGGISIKPAAEMDEMKYDMSGAASVLGVFRSLAELKPAINVVGLIPSCENMPDGRAVKPGDVVTSMSGQTIEIRLPDGSWTQPVARTTLPAADPVSQTVEWRLDLDANAAAAWLPGQQVQVRFVSAQADKLTVPAEAVFRRGELTAVYVAAQVGGAEGFVLRAVRLGAAHGSGGHEVLAGLRPGEKVALDPVRAGLAGARPASKP